MEAAGADCKKLIKTCMDFLVSHGPEMKDGGGKGWSRDNRWGDGTSMLADGKLSDLARDGGNQGTGGSPFRGRKRVRDGVMTP